MSFGLKNARATYQRLVNKMFSKQIGRNMEVYVDDMLVKSKEELTHLDNLEETFTTLRQYQMKLKPSKCAFGVVLRKFLGFMVSQRGIEASKPGEGEGHTRHDITQDRKKSLKAHRKNGRAQQVRL